MYTSMTVLGFIERDPETHVTPIGARVTIFPVATARKYSRADGTEVKETTRFTVEVWGKLGDAVKKYTHKGSKVLVVGRLVPDIKTGGPYIYNRGGRPAASFVIRADTVRFLDNKTDETISKPPVPKQSVEEEYDPGGIIFTTILGIGPDDDIPF